MRVMDPERLSDAIQEAVADGRRRVVVAGGDGSIASAARCLVGTGVELAIVPGGTLNHRRDSVFPPISDRVRYRTPTHLTLLDFGYYGGL